MPLSPGQVLNNRYRIVKLLGQGGFGAVYRAWDMNMKAPCAVKENTETSPAAQNQFEREATLLFQLRHAGLPRVYDHFVAPGQGQYLVMDFIEGQDLQSMLDLGGAGRAPGAPLPEAQVLAWVGQVCDALAYMHRQKTPIIHRDIKPANIVITPEGQAVLVDFGIAKAFNPNVKTTLGARAVTPGYSPIEQYGQGTTDARSDVYSLGATLYTLLTGQLPPEATARAVWDNLGPAILHDPRWSVSTAQAMQRALQLDPGQRFQTAAELAAALSSTAPTAAQPPTVVVQPAQMQAAAALPSTAAQPATPSWQRLPSGVWIALAAALVGVVYLLIANSGGFWPFAAPAADPTRTSTVTPVKTIASPTRIPGRAPTFTASVSSPTKPESIPTWTIEPTSSTEPPANAQLGDTWTRPSDKMLMLFIPEGEFLMGSADSDSLADSDEKPQHTVYLDPYWIDRTEVTNAQYTICVAEGQCQPPSDSRSYTRSSYYGEAQYANYPVIYVSWDEAVAYCAWAGGRLPTEAEWEKAARGTQGQIYPWGNQQPSCQLANYSGCESDTSAVGSYPDGASPYGLLDMAGNVWEWVQDWYNENYYASSLASNPAGPSSGDYRVRRGGSWDIRWYYIRAANRSYHQPGLRSGHVGFRCRVFPGR